MAVLILGSSGGIGTRWRAIASFHQEPFFTLDPQPAPPFLGEQIVTPQSLRSISRKTPVIISTPSPTHFRVLKRYIDLGFQEFLIEKPMFTEWDHYQRAQEFEKAGIRIRMVSNYRFLNGTGGLTSYNYFDAGREKPIWNLFQLLALADGEMEFKNDSPVWKCTLNGRRLTLEGVQESFILQWSEFLTTPAKGVDVERAEGWFLRALKFKDHVWALASKHA